jgi:hypothetical protein
VQEGPRRTRAHRLPAVDVLRAIDRLSDGIRQDLQAMMVYSTSKSIKAL